MILSHILNVNLVKRLIFKKCLSIALTFTQQGEVPRKAVGRVPYVVGTQFYQLWGNSSFKELNFDLQFLYFFLYSLFCLFFFFLEVVGGGLNPGLHTC